MLDQGEVDDKVIAVLKGDAAYGACRSISDVSTATIDRLRHYFLTYKQAPDATSSSSIITHVYDRDEAFEVIARSMEDYSEQFGGLETLLTEALQLTGSVKGGES